MSFASPDSWSIFKLKMPQVKTQALRPLRAWSIFDQTRPPAWVNFGHFRFPSKALTPS